MTKLVRKLKQMAKKRAHRKGVQKRKLERLQREMEEENEAAEKTLEEEVDREVARLNGNDSCMDREEGETVDGGKAVQRSVRILGGLVLDAPKRKQKKQLSRKQMRRKKKVIERGVAIVETIDKKWAVKKMRVKTRAQARNQDLHT